MRAIDRKILRDVRTMKTQLIAIAAVIAAGVGLFLGMRTTMRTLDTARAQYYASERFGDLFASLVRAPEHVADTVRKLPGIARVQSRVVADVLLDVPGSTDAASGRLVSIPDRGRPAVGDLRLRSGRLPLAGRAREVVAHEAFALANDLHPGARLSALIDGKRTLLEVVGVALSPEFTYAIGPGQILPDARRFGILWMARDPLGNAFDLDGAFNDLAIQVDARVSVDAIIAAVDRLLEPYGGTGAYTRSDQLSDAFVSNELEQLRTFGSMLPGMFLFVAMFLLNVVVGRLVAGQREQIAALKSLGYRDRELGMHYAKLTALVGAVGLALGIALGGWIGTTMCRLYLEYYRFPELRYQMQPGEVLFATSLTLLAAFVGAGAAITRTVRLPPAEAMRPPAPPTYRATVLERLGLAALVPPQARIVLRELERRPLRATMSVSGIALATALVIVSTFAYGSIGLAMNVQFGLQQREDVALALTRPREIGALTDLEHLPGVRHAEPFRVVPVRVRHGARSDDVTITGVPRQAGLRAVLDVDRHDVAPAGDGIVLTRKLAEKLAVHRGDQVRIDIREGRRATHEVIVTRIAETYLGMSAYMELHALCRLLGETPTMNGAYLLVDERQLASLHREVKRMPLIAGIAERRAAIETFRRMVDDNLGTSLAISLAFALVMALGVLYNAVRITLAERSRDLASLRVLGFRRREVCAILLGEIGLLTILAIPIGLGLGHLGARSMMATLDTEQLRMPFVIAPWTDALAVSTVLAAAALASYLAWRRLERLDIVEVLKTRE